MKLTYLLISLPLFSLGAWAQLTTMPRPQAQPQGPPQPPGTVSGKVTNSITGQPIKRATVNLRGGRSGYVTVSDISGNFSFENVQPANNYFASADAEGYANQTTGAQVSAIKVGPQQDVRDISLQLAPLSVISGKVLSDEGEPLQGVTVQALTYRYQNGIKRLMPSSSATTDDRGQYRVFDIQPGHYYLSATKRVVSQGAAAQAGHIHSTIAEEGYARLYHPSASEMTQATAIDVKPGAEINGVDFKLRKMPVYHIRGTVVDAQTRQPLRANVTMQECDNGPFAGPGMQMGAMAQPNGGFDIRGVVAGMYCLSLQQNGQRTLYGRQTVSVKNENVDGVVLLASPGVEIQGSMVVSGTPPATMPRMFIRLESADGMMGSQNPNMKPDSTFTIGNVAPGAYTVIIQALPQQMYVKSLQYGNQDVSSGKIQVGEGGGALVVTLGTDPGQVKGTVQPSSSNAGAFAGMVAPAGGNESRRDLQRVFMSQDGSFSTGGLAPGEYKVFAFESSNFTDLEDIELRKLLEDKATTVTVHAGGTETVQVRGISADAIAEAKTRVQ